MRVFKKVDEIKAYLRKQQNKGKTIGLVPTMGYLHEGHQSLIRRASAENDIAVVSIFVNPIQFGEGEDFERYPRDIDKDMQAAEGAGAMIIFAPEVREMYPDGYKTYVEVKDITEVLCGASRPGHFRGAATAVLKLFNIVRPDKAYFGRKDAQQAVVIKRMAEDLNSDVDIVVCPIVREDDGLAMSSRNIYLSGEERKQALALSKSLKMAGNLIIKGERNAEKVKKAIHDMISENDLAAIDYISVVDVETLKDVDRINGRILIALAVKFGATRLIDNLTVEV